ncbi:hypothetical protein FJZ17_00720 [Candidatus Pacearchaeota archaeon]|nr:hypothetical protein [Candidatus Pacearchaeota archaeon]
MTKQEIKTTTIKISEKTRERIEHLKEHKEESADSLINKALNILNICVRSPALAGRILRDIEKAKKRKELLEHPETIIKKKPSQPSVQQNIQGNINKMRSNLVAK